MTTILTQRARRCAVQALVLAAVLSAPACEEIYDSEGDCDPRYYVQFVYDMNMLGLENGTYADAFYSMATSVNLYIFDAESGDYLTCIPELDRQVLADRNYRMPLDLEPGNYYFVAWANLASSDNFSVPTTIADTSDLVCTLARREFASVFDCDRNLNKYGLFHGAVQAELPDSAGDHIVTVRMTKNTNNIVLSLSHTAGLIDPNRFSVTLTDANGRMAHDNTLLPDQVITYRPWSVRSGYLDLGDSQPADSTSAGTDGGDTSRAILATRADSIMPDTATFFIAEIGTARLMADHEARITITDTETGKTVFSIPFVQYALKLRSANYHYMSPQEYLDREDDYNLMVFLTDSGERWTALEIVINGWHIISHEVEF